MEKAKEKIKWRILVPLVSAFGILLVVSILTVHILYAHHINDEVQKGLSEVKRLFEIELDDNAMLLDGWIDFLQKDKDLRDAWLAEDRKTLLKYTTPVFNKLRRKYNLTHFYFHGLDRVCFLRVHNPPRHGDYIDRFTMDSALREDKTAYGIELGPLGTFTLRVVHPWRIDGRLTGYIELGEEIDHITTKLKKALDVELCHILNKSYLDRAKWEEGMKMLGRQPKWDQFPDFVLSGNTLPELPLTLRKYLERLVTCEGEEHLSHVLKLSLDNRHYRGQFLPLIDAGGRDVGDIVVYADVTGAVAGLKAFSAILTLCYIIVAFLSLGFFYFYVGQIEHRLVNSYNSLQENEAKMRSVLETAPDYILNVDRDGKILFINRTVQGITVEEAIGTNICDHIPPEYQDKMRNTIEQVFQTGQCQSLDTVVTPDGINIKTWQVTRIGPVMCGQEVVAATIISTDITGRKHTEEMLEKKMEEFSQFNKLAVGRELRMIELKKEVDALLRELGGKEKYRDEIEYIENNANTLKPKIS